MDAIVCEHEYVLTEMGNEFCAKCGIEVKFRYSLPTYTTTGDLYEFATFRIVTLRDNSRLD